MSVNFVNYKYNIVSLFILFNLLFVFPYLILIKLPPDELVANWRTLQYFFSYDIEFMKRGLLGTFFDIFNIEPTLRTIWMIALLSANMVFFLTYNYVKRALEFAPNSSIVLFMLFFVISPVTAWNFGFAAGRADLFNLVIELIIINIIIINNKHMFYSIPFLIVIGILMHEAFIFMGAPIIMALLILRFTERKMPISVVIISGGLIISVGLLLALYGKIDPTNFEILYSTIYKQPIPSELPTINTFMIVTSPLSENILFTLKEYLTLHVWKYFIVALPLLFAYMYIYLKSLTFSSLSIEKKILFLSPFLVFPMFVLGVDIYRWFSMMLINMFIVLLYLVYTNTINLSFLKEKYVKVSLYVIVVYSLFGPIGARSSFPYVEQVIKRIL